MTSLHHSEKKTLNKSLIVSSFGEARSARQFRPKVGRNDLYFDNSTVHSYKPLAMTKLFNHITILLHEDCGDDQIARVVHVPSLWPHASAWRWHSAGLPPCKYGPQNTFADARISHSIFCDRCSQPMSDNRLGSTFHWRRAKRLQYSHIVNRQAFELVLERPHMCLTKTCHHANGSTLERGAGDLANLPFQFMQWWSSFTASTLIASCRTSSPVSPL